MMLNSHDSYTGSEDNSDISIVVPAYNEEGNIHKLYEELIKVLPFLDVSWEIIFVDDGSVDETWEEIVSLHRMDKHIKGIRFSRNFGHQYALLSGLSQASGKAVISMDADLQHPPQTIPKLVEEWRKGSKIVHAMRLDIENVSFFKSITSRLFYKMFAFLSGVEVEDGMADFRLLDRQVLNNILQLREEGFFLRGLVQWVGYPSSKVMFQCQKRFSGSSKYTLKKMLKLALSGITSFSIVPLRLGIFIGMLTSVIAFGGLVYAVSSFLMGVAVHCWSSIVFIFSLLFGVLFILLGLIGEYIGRILIEVRCRPRFLIREKVGIKNTARDNFI